jgi:exodeoxyribonuclease VII large subunit
MQKTTKIYTVSQVNSLIKGILRNNLPGRLIIKGEISNWRVGPTGHRYFSLKEVEVNSTLPCAMWNDKFAKVKFRPENGLAVLATGSIDVYIPHGRYQFIVDALEPEGVGARQLALEQMKKKLQARGLFDEAHKQPIPSYPERIGILTSESGAAVEDIKDSIWNRWPCVELFLYPVPVQGEGAAEKIAAAVRDLNRRNNKLKLDLLIVGRGGGSLEDLWAFNEEVLVRAIFDSKIPIISAVGHEVDTTIADFVADARASTPTKAGIVAVPDMQEVLEQLAYLQERLESKAKLLLHNSEQQSDELLMRLGSSVRQLLAEARARLYSIDEQVRKIEPHRLLRNKILDLNNLSIRAKTAVRNTIDKARLQLTAQTSLLTGLNPKSVLQRGYSITTNKETGRLVRRLQDVQIQDYLITELANQNFIESKVTKKQNKAK